MAPGQVEALGCESRKQNCVVGESQGKADNYQYQTGAAQVSGLAGREVRKAGGGTESREKTVAVGPSKSAR